MWPFKRKHPPREELALEDSWSVSAGGRQGRPLIVRVNQGVAPAVRHPDYAHQVGVAVPLNDPDGTGLPGMDESEQLAGIEKSLAERLEEGRHCLFVATITTDGMREFVFYTSDPEETRRRVEAVGNDVDTHQLQLMIQTDPKWKVYRQLA